MDERKLAIQEQYAWRKGGSRLKMIQAFQIWPLSVRLKTDQQRKVFQLLYDAISLFLFFGKQMMQSTYEVEALSLCS